MLIDVIVVCIYIYEEFLIMFVIFYVVLLMFVVKRFVKKNKMFIGFMFWIFKRIYLINKNFNISELIRN